MARDSEQKKCRVHGTFYGEGGCPFCASKGEPLQKAGDQVKKTQVRGGTEIVGGGPTGKGVQVHLREES